MTETTTEFARQILTQTIRIQEDLQDLLRQNRTDTDIITTIMSDIPCRLRFLITEDLLARRLHRLICLIIGRIRCIVPML